MMSKNLKVSSKYNQMAHEIEDIIIKYNPHQVKELMLVWCYFIVKTWIQVLGPEKFKQLYEELRKVHNDV